MTETKTILNDLFEEPFVRHWFETNLKGNALSRVDDCTRLATWLIAVNKVVNLKGKYSRNESNLATVATYGFSTVDRFLINAMELIRLEGLKNFKVKNLRIFLERLKPFIEFDSNIDQALKSLLPRKFGVFNDKGLSKIHFELIEDYANQDFESLAELCRKLNQEFAKRKIKVFNLQTLRIAVRNVRKNESIQI